MTFVYGLCYTVVLGKRMQKDNTLPKTLLYILGEKQVWVSNVKFLVYYPNLCRNLKKLANKRESDRLVTQIGKTRSGCNWILGRRQTF